MTKENTKSYAELIQEQIDILLDPASSLKAMYSAKAQIARLDEAYEQKMLLNPAKITSTELEYISQKIRLTAVPYLSDFLNMVRRVITDEKTLIKIRDTVEFNLKWWKETPEAYYGRLANKK